MIVQAPPPERTKPKAAPAPSSPLKDWWIEVAPDRSALEKHLSAWEHLAKEAVEPNAFYEPWMFLPALDTFASKTSLCHVLVYRHDPRPKQPPQLCGFFPLERRARFKGLPIRTLRLWDHPYSMLCTPLVHRDWARETLTTFFDGIAAAERPSLLDWSKIHGDGPFQQALLDVLNERRMLSFVDEVYTRALLRRGADAESYGAAAMNHQSRKEWRRQRRRLGEQGKLESRVLQTEENVEVWIDQFLDLEASGWKGQEKTALAMSDADRAYFRTIARNAHARHQLQMLGIYFNDRPIALKCNFLTQAGGFAFKIAFDEAYSKSSPGVQLELDNIEELHRRLDLQWMDSCAIPGHFMINRLWKDRRTIQSLVIAASRWTGNAVVGALPLLRALKRMCRR
jgi:CelD/BcsL family acetyltransferase involved in cellulose biosynthesis